MKNVLTSIAFIAGASCAIGAFAQQPAASAPQRIGTRDDLRWCMTSEGKLKAQRDALEAQVPELNKRAEEAKAENEEAEADSKKLNDPSTTGPWRDRLERKMREHTAKIKQFQEFQAKFVAEKDKWQADRTAYEGKCVGVSYRKDDVDAVRQELGTAK